MQFDDKIISINGNLLKAEIKFSENAFSKITIQISNIKLITFEPRFSPQNDRNKDPLQFVQRLL